MSRVCLTLVAITLVLAGCGGNDFLDKPFTAADGGSSSSGGANPPGACLPSPTSPCYQCLSTQCGSGLDQCLADLTCSSRCTGPAAVPLFECLSAGKCRTGTRPACTSTDEGLR